MLRASVVACVVVSLVGCGPSVPKHNGYKTKSPWKKAKQITFDASNAGKAKGDLDYAGRDRAQWYYVELPKDGDLRLALQFTPTDDAGDATVAMEVLDGGFNVISEDMDAPLEPEKKEAGEDDEDDDEDEDADAEGSGETKKDRQLPQLSPGRYYIHLFVTGRMDSADFELSVGFTPVAKDATTGTPKNIAFVPALPIVPPHDDAPATAQQPTKKKKKGGGGSKKEKEPVVVPEDTGTTGTAGPLTARVIDAKAASGGGTDITINAGTDLGLAAGRKGSLAGVKNGGFVLASCGNRTCKATVKATIDEVNRSSGQVSIK